jgi:hypothetical protein
LGLLKGTDLHENPVYYAIQRALYRSFPDLKETESGRHRVSETISDIMTEIKESGINYVNQKGE